MIVMATVVVRMKLCDKVHRITAELLEDGDIGIKIESDCDHVMDFAKNLGDKLTIEEVTEREGSKLFDSEVLKPLTLTCMAPLGVLDASWLELGMISKNLAKSVGENSISYEEL